MKTHQYKVEIRKLNIKKPETLEVYNVYGTDSVSVMEKCLNLFLDIKGGFNGVKNSDYGNDNLYCCFQNGFLTVFVNRVMCKENQARFKSPDDGLRYYNPR